MELNLVEMVEALRTSLAEAVRKGANSDVQFPVQGAQLEVHVAAKKEGSAAGKVKVLVVEAGGAGSLSREEIHKLTVMLGAPTETERGGS